MQYTYTVPEKYIKEEVVNVVLDLCRQADGSIELTVQFQPQASGGATLLTFKPNGTVSLEDGGEYMRERCAHGRESEDGFFVLSLKKFFESRANLYIERGCAAKAREKK